MVYKDYDDDDYPEWENYMTPEEIEEERKERELDDKLERAFNCKCGAFSRKTGERISDCYCGAG